MGIVRKRRRFALPAVRPDVAERFLSRPLDNHDWMKEIPKADLVAHCRDLGHRFASDPWHNQLVCFALGVAHPGFMFFLKMGGGKSMITLELIRYRKRLGHLQRAIIVVPYLIHLVGWEENWRKHAPDLSYRILSGESSDRLDRPSDVILTTYATVQSYMSRRVKARGAKVGQAKIDPGPAGEFAANFNFMALDEMHRLLRRRDNITYHTCRWLGLAASFRYGLDATPFGRDPLPLWSQFNVVDQGETLGQTLTPFRQTFYTAKEHYWAGIEYAFDKSTTPELRRIIKHRSISYELNELRDVPPKIPIRIPVHLGKEGAAYYKRIVDGLKEARGDYRSLEAAFMRMRQAASGFIAMRADDDSRIEVQFKENPKMDMLHQFVLSKEDKILVFHEFKVSGALIEAMLRQAKVGYAALRGGVGDAAKEYGRFLTDPKCQVFVLNNTIGSENINPQYVCRRAVFYESPVDPTQREQAEGRVQRPGQEWVTFIYDLLVKGTVEEKILKYVREGRDLLRDVLSGDEDLSQDAD